MKISAIYNDKMNNILLFNAHTTNATNEKETNLRLKIDFFRSSIILLDYSVARIQSIQLFTVPNPVSMHRQPNDLCLME